PSWGRAGLARVRGAPRDNGKGLGIESALSEPVRHVRARSAREKKLGRAAVRLHIEIPRGLEVALGHRHGLAVNVDLRRNQRRASKLAFRVSRPLAGHEPT